MDAPYTVVIWEISLHISVLSGSLLPFVTPPVGSAYIYSSVAEAVINRDAMGRVQVVCISFSSAWRRGRAMYGSWHAELIP